MKKKKNAKGSRTLKTKSGLIIKYIRVPALNQLLKKQLLLGKWRRKQAERIEKLRGTPKWEEEMRKFRNLLLEKKSALLKMEHAYEARRDRRLPEPLFRPFPPYGSISELVLSFTRWESEDLPPDEILVGHSYLEDGQVVFEPSNLIYPCPDNGKGEWWSAWFQNNAVELYRRSEYTIEGEGFTGQMRISMNERAEGVAVINSGGYVSLSVGASVHLWRNIGTAAEPQWRQVGVSSIGTAYPGIRTSDTGLVSLEPAASSLWWEFAEARPRDVVETRQHVYIKAVDAHVQMGYNRTDCESGNGVGYIYTSMPSLELRYFNRIKPSLKAIPRDLPWS